MTHYTFSITLYLIRCYIRTKLFYNNCRLIRFPFDIRNKQKIRLGKGFTTGHYCRIEVCNDDNYNNKVLIIGDNVQINDFVHIAANQSVKIGNNVLIASKVYISDINHGDYGIENYDINVKPSEQPLSSKPVEIKNNVWIGESVSVLPGVTIGEGAIIGAMACVTKNIPPYSIAVGNPAKVIKIFDFTSKRWIRV